MAPTESASFEVVTCGDYPAGVKVSVNLAGKEPGRGEVRREYKSVIGGGGGGEVAISPHAVAVARECGSPPHDRRRVARPGHDQLVESDDHRIP